MEPIETELLPLEPSEPSLAVQLTRVLIVNGVGFIAGHFAGKAFDKILESRANKPEPLAEIKDLNA